MSILILITVSFAQVRTSTNTCTNEKSIFKFDVRQKVQDLPPQSTVRDIDAYAVCQEAYMYDYIWLYQMWIPGQFNFKQVSGGAQQVNDYRELQSIKEYLIDPELGLLTDLYFFQNNIRKFCPHMKFLGEFSFYISQDSYLIQNKTRFLRRPYTDSQGVYDSRYDNYNFVWAVNDRMKTIPYTVAWNYFDPVALNDMKDIIYRIIINQHRLDGIVFLQPSLGLYNFMAQNFQREIQFFGKSSLFKDFYLNIGLKLNSQDIYYMGGDDSSNSKIILYNYLSQIYGNPSPKVWENMNYTFTSMASSINRVDLKTVKAGSGGSYGQVNTQDPPSGPGCISYYIKNQNGGVRFGVLNTQSVKFVLATSGLLVHDSDSLLNGTQSFGFANLDMIEMQYITSSGQFIFMKYSNDQANFQQLSLMIPGTYVYLRFMLNVRQNSEIQIKFPFLFSQKYKHSNLVIQNTQQITMTTYLNQNLFYYAQIWPSINQNENNVTLNFKITSMNNSIVIGLCNQEGVQKGNHQYPPTNPFGSGVYMWHNAGYFWHNSSTTYNNLHHEQQFYLGDIISVTFTKSNQSIQFYKNSVYVFSLPMIDKVKNLNFCTAMESTNSVVNLVY